MQFSLHIMSIYLRFKLSQKVDFHLELQLTTLWTLAYCGQFPERTQTNLCPSLHGFISNETKSLLKDQHTVTVASFFNGILLTRV